MFKDMFNKVWHYISIFPFSNQRKRSLNLKQKKQQIFVLHVETQY